MTAPRRPLEGTGSAVFLLIMAGALQSCSAQAPDEAQSARPAEGTVAPVATPPPAPPPPQAAPAQEPSEPVSLAIYILSRGRGVPERTRAVYQEIQALLKEQQATYVVTNLSTRRIGLEGETRLCAEFRDRTEARATLEKIRKLAAGVELLNVVEEPCTQSKEAKP